MSEQKKEKISSDKRMVKDSSVTKKEREEAERIEKLEETTADLAARVKALESRLA